MYCPTCKAIDTVEVHLKSGVFQEDMGKCSVCGTSWAINHGTVEVVADAQEKSFLSATTECVECDDYNMAFSRAL